MVLQRNGNPHIKREKEKRKGNKKKYKGMKLQKIFGFPSNPWSEIIG